MNHKYLKNKRSFKRRVCNDTAVLTNKTVSIIGLITGAGQIVLGSANFPKENKGWGTNYTNESQKTLSMVNIGLGTTTMILSAWN